LKAKIDLLIWASDKTDNF